jgi:branched-chain amino acid transport system substrate-binding protein
VNLVTKQAKEKGITATFIGGDGWDSPDLDSKSAAGGYFTNHYSPYEERPIVVNFVKKYGDKYKNADGTPKLPDALAALAYDATNMLLQAIKDTGKDDPKKVKDVLAKGKFDVVSGEVTFDAFHTPIKPVTVVEVREDRPYFLTKFIP